MLRQADFVDRNNFADYLNRTKRLGVAVEVGVHRGEFASLFLYNWLGKVYYGVDPWAPVPGYEDQEVLLADRGKTREDDYQHTIRTLRKYQDKAHLLRSISAVACQHLSNAACYPDFVYIDGDHRYGYVLSDLRRWWELVVPGGILAGHDFVTHGEDVPQNQVQPAVMDFARQMQLDVWIVTEPLCLPWSFYFVKP